MNTLSALIRQHRDEILEGWLTRAAQLPSAQSVSAPALRDHVPDILNKLADAIDRRDESARPLEDLPEQHAALRLQEGYDLRQVLAEYRLLREAIMEMYAERGDLSVEWRPKLKPLTVMHEAIDRAIADVVDHYAAERDRVRETFIAMLGHDLREPLNAIAFTANAQLRRSDDLDAAAVKSAARIATGANRMERMIRDLLDFARTRLGDGFTVVPKSVDARPLIAHTVLEMAQTYPERNVRCLAETAAGDFRVEWDPDRISQVITNLVSNALAHGSDPVVVEPRDEGAEIAINVCNRGEISPDVLPRLFEAFSPEARVESSGTRRTGLGLGLFIAQQVARAHGGDIHATSSDGQTKISVRLPRHPPRAPQKAD
jgi:signal transduction histidine kinase